MFVLGVFFVVFSLFTIVAASQVPKLWRHQTTVAMWERAPRSWPWGGASWRGLVRSIPVSILGLVSLSGSLLFGLAIGGRQELSAAQYAILVALTGMFGTALLLMTTITLFNWPSFLVPPHLRSQAGAVREWFGGLHRPSRVRR